MDNTAYKGAILVLVGILVGVLILAVALDEPVKESVAIETTTTTVEEADDTEDEETTPTTASFVPRDPSVTKVIVANGADVDGAAGFLTNELNSFNYNTLTATNTDEPQDESRIYYLPGWEPEAREIARVLGYTDAAYIDVLVQQLPVDLDFVEIEDAKVVIILGGPDEFVPQPDEDTSTDTTEEPAAT